MTLKAPVLAQYLGDPTELVCQVSNISNWGNRLSVCWFYSTLTSDGGQGDMQVIASLNENGAVIPNANYRDRIDLGLILVTRIEPATFKLRLLRTTNADVGEYVCSVTTWTLTRHGVWKYTSEHQANALKVSLDSKGERIFIILLKCYSFADKKNIYGHEALPGENKYSSKCFPLSKLQILE